MFLQLVAPWWRYTALQTPSPQNLHHQSGYSEVAVPSGGKSSVTGSRGPSSYLLGKRLSYGFLGYGRIKYFMPHPTMTLPLTHVYSLTQFFSIVAAGACSNSNSNHNKLRWLTQNTKNCVCVNQNAYITRIHIHLQYLAMSGVHLHSLWIRRTQ